jgi:hypothetical protein
VTHVSPAGLLFAAFLIASVIGATLISSLPS